MEVFKCKGRIQFPFFFIENRRLQRAKGRHFRSGGGNVMETFGHQWNDIECDEKIDYYVTFHLAEISCD